MFSNSGHVCEGVRGRKRRDTSNRKHRKEHPEINSSNCGLFTCGGCHNKFKTICCLHVHIDKHQEGGSYTFDHITKTAFPKYDSICAFTQVESKFFEMMGDNFIGSEKLSLSKSIQTLDENEENEHTGTEDSSIRKSKRIAKRNFDKDKVKSNKEKKSDVILEVNDVKRMKSVNSLVDTPFPLPASENESVKLKRKNITKVENFSIRKKKQKELVQSKKLVGSPLNNSKVEDLEGISKSPHKKEKSDAEKVDMYVRLDNLESMNPKTDEIAASEALLAISKSADGEIKDGVSSVRSEIVNVVKADVTKYLNETSKGKECEEGKRDTGFSNSNKNVNMQEVAYVKFLDAIKQESDDETLSQDTKPERHKCPTCGKYGSRAMISYHKHLHKDQKELSCDVCGKQFQHPSCLKVHLRSHSDRMYSCDICDSKFSRKIYLETHMLKHTGEKPYMCDACGKGYRDSNHLKRHIKHVHDKKRDFECDICQERFFRSDHLKCHRMRHFGPGHRCPVCKKMFKVKLDLERHAKTHTAEEEKRWFCLICGHGYRHPVPYYNHMSTKHEVSRHEAEASRKKQLEDKRKAPHQLYIVKKTLDPADNYTDLSEANVREEIKVASIEHSRPAVVPAVRKIFIPRNHMISGSVNITDSLNIKNGPFEFNNKSKEVRATSNERILNPKHESNNEFGQIDNVYEIVNMGYRSESKAVHVLSNLSQDTTSLQQGFTFALQNAFTEEEIDGARDGGIVGYGEGDQLQGDQLVVMAEETVVGDMNMMSEMTGENTQAVIFLDQSDTAGEDVIQKQTII